MAAVSAGFRNFGVYIFLRRYRGNENSVMLDIR
jgi:hypothetical protein